MIVAALVSGIVAASVVASPSGLPPPIVQLLKTARWDHTPRGFRIIALSHVADLCVAIGPPLAAASCVRRVRELARATKPARVDLRAPDVQEGLWLTHYNLILGDLLRVAPDSDAIEHHAISSALAARSRTDGIVPSFPARAARWPADQAATLASLARHDAAHGTKLTAPAYARYREVVRVDDKTQLPWSELLHTTETSTMPRGCALSWSVRYLAEVDRPAAQALWQRYVALYAIDAGLFSGLREWPPGDDRAADVDSGPIIRGVGAAATAFGLLAARAIGDDAMHARLAATARLAESLGLADRTAQTVLAVSIRELGLRL